MTPTKEEVVKAQWIADEARYGSDGNSWALVVLAAALRASEARAELAERQYEELLAWGDDDTMKETWIGMLNRHERERKELRIERSTNERPKE